MLIFQVENLNYRYNQELILKNINLSYDNDDFLAIIGPNGGGKSTLIKIILGFMGKNHSIVWHICNQKQIGYVPQNTLANPNFPARVLEVVLMGRVDKKIFGFYSESDRQKAFEMLERVGVAAYWNKRIGDLSGGQRQRVFIARALVGECQLLILDEPTASVDLKNSIQIFELLRILHQEGIGIITVCHDINLVLAYANKIAHLNQELFLHDNNENDKHDFIEHLLQHHQHFCDVEMTLNTCVCEKKHD